VYPDEPGLAAQAAALAAQVDANLLANMPADAGLVLRLCADGLELIDTRPGAPGAIRADFAPLARRAVSIRGEAIARAVGLKGGQMLRVIDATAGLGRDAFVLASLGAQVHLIERSPVICALLADALARARQIPALAPAAARMTLHQGDALNLLPALSRELAADAIYLDPMYPATGTKGQVKKDMQLLRTLLGPVTDAEALLQTALASACRRVVVKRPRRAPTLSSTRLPSHAIQSRNTRFEVYLA
jgi:16S rRNA (guanine1516-N2)-methyltransferase